MASTEEFEGFGLGLLAGAAIGLAVGLLYAPRPGADTRQLIQRRAGEMAEAVREKVGALRGTSDGEAEEIA